MSRILQTERIFMKVLWSLMILASVSFGLYVIINSFIDYNRHEVVTQTHIIEPESMTFPAVSVCTTSIPFSGGKFR